MKLIDACQPHAVACWGGCSAGLTGSPCGCIQQQGGWEPGRTEPLFPGGTFTPDFTAWKSQYHHLREGKKKNPCKPLEPRIISTRPQMLLVKENQKASPDPRDGKQTHLLRGAVAML